MDRELDLPAETHLVRGVAFGLLFVAPFWIAVVEVALRF